MKWEYDVVDRPTLVDLLDRYGSHGWELVAVCQAAFDKELEIGSTIPWLDGSYRIVRQIPREEWWATVLRNREADRLMGLPRARAGTLLIDDEGGTAKPIQFMPDWTEPGPEFRYCYILEKLP